MQNKGLLLVVSGPSGVGKGTLLKEYQKLNESLHMSVSATTRNPRPGEEDGREYFFLTKEKFMHMAENDEMLEYAIYSENCYGTPKNIVFEKLNQGIDVVLEIEVQGAMQIKERCSDATLIFIMPPSYETLKNRLVGRNTETIEVINKRLNAAKNEISKAASYDYVLVNDDLEEAAKTLNLIVEAARFKGNRYESFVEEILNSK